MSWMRDEKTPRLYLKFKTDIETSKQISFGGYEVKLKSGKNVIFDWLDYSYFKSEEEDVYILSAYNLDEDVNKDITFEDFKNIEKFIEFYYECDEDVNVEVLELKFYNPTTNEKYEASNDIIESINNIKILDNPKKYLDNMSSTEFNELLDEFGFEYKNIK